MKLRFVIAPGTVLYIKPEEITPGKIVHRNDAGQIVAKLNQEGYESIPISHKYQNQIAKIV